MNNKGNLYTVSAPSGAGKTSLVNALIECTTDICVSISHTTRDIRAGEEHGIDYHFVGQDEFAKMIRDKAFLEHAKVFSNQYGTSKAWVEGALNQGKDVILEIDWQGAAQVRKLMPDAISIFILPPSKDSLKNRLKTRGRDDESVIDARMAEAKSEMSHYGESDYLIINDSFDEAMVEFRSIIIGERLKLEKQSIRHHALLMNLLS